MKVSFLIREMIYNQVCKDRIMYIDDEQKIIKHIKCVPRSEDIQIHFTDGDVAMANENNMFDFEVNNRKEWKEANKKQIKMSKKNK